MTYLAQKLAFPDVKDFNDLFGDIEPKQDREFADKAVISNWLHYSPKHRSEYRVPSNGVLEYVRNHMIPVDYDSIYFQVIERSDGTLITAQYNQIIGNRWLALIDSDTVPEKSK